MSARGGWVAQTRAVGVGLEAMQDRSEAINVDDKHSCRQLTAAASCGSVNGLSSAGDRTAGDVSSVGSFHSARIDVRMRCDE